jgi:sec-independent protein translocase protein TatB
MFPEGRIFDFLLVGVIALIVVGPKDLPVLMRRVGEFVGKMRAMAAEFRASFDEMARQSELDDLRKEVEAMRAGRGPAAMAGAALGVGAGSHAAEVFDDIGAGLGTGASPAPSGYAYPASFGAGREDPPPETGSGASAETPLPMAEAEAPPELAGSTPPAVMTPLETPPKASS